MKKGFTIAEVLTVLLLLSIVFAVSAPIITKRSIRFTRSNNPPWQWVENTTSNVRRDESGADAVTVIGRADIPSDANSPKMLISSDNSARNQITFYQGENNFGSISLNEKGIAIGIVDDDIVTTNKKPMISIGNTSVSDGGIGIGYNTTCAENSIAISNATASAANSIAIGHNSVASGAGSIAFGSNTIAAGTNSVVIGNGSAWGGDDVILLALNFGNGTRPSQYPSYINTSILTYSRLSPITLPTNNIVLIGGQQDTVITSNRILLPATAYVGTIEATNVKTRNLYSMNPVLSPSDKRFKSIKKENKNGLEKINKLNVYDYTLNSDPKKKRVGIIAQELIKIFPDAVSKDEKGYYFVRKEDIFFALVNAVKEIDLKVSKLVNEISTRIKKYSEISEQLIAVNDELKEQDKKIKSLKRRINLLKSKLY